MDGFFILAAVLCSALAVAICVLRNKLHYAEQRTRSLEDDLARKEAFIVQSSELLEEGNRRGRELASQFLALKQENTTLLQKVEFQTEQYAKLLGQKKSSETRVGLVTEQIAPFLNDYPFDPRNARFIGMPIDIISFEDDKIVFVEVKTGKSQLSKKQRQIRDHIAAGKVEFIVYKVEGE